MMFGCTCQEAPRRGLGQAGSLLDMCNRLVRQGAVGDVQVLLARTIVVLLRLAVQFAGTAAQTVLDNKVAKLRAIAAKSKQLPFTMAAREVHSGDDSAICGEVLFAEEQARLNPEPATDAARFELMTVIEAFSFTVDEERPTVVTLPPPPPVAQDTDKPKKFGFGVALAGVGLLTLVGIIAYAATRAPEPPPSRRRLRK